MTNSTERVAMALWMKAAIALAPILLSGNIAFMGWLTQKITAMDGRVTVLEVSSVTNKDALATWTAIAEIKQDVARMPNEMPPKWFVERVDRLERKLDDNAARMQALELYVREKK